MFDWLKKILGISTNNSSSESKDEGTNTFMLDSLNAKLEEKKINAKKEKENLKQSSVDWYSLIIPHNKKPTTRGYYPYCFEQLLNLKTLKEKRLKREAHELKVLEEEVRILLGKIENYIAQRKVEEAKQAIKVVCSKIFKVKDSSIRQRYINLQDSLCKLVDELEQKRLSQLAEEHKRKEEEKRKKEEAEERGRKEKERQIEEKQRKQEEEAKKLVEEARKKEQAEQTERQRLELLSTERKEDWTDFKQVLENNGIKYLYHFTDRRNIPSIKRHGGLFSWHYCLKNNITIPCQGGDYDSRELDKKYGLEDYVRLSFCDDHPMAYRLQQSGSDIITLKIKVDVALLKHTLFSDINAADKLHTHGGCLENLNRVNFNATKRHYISRNDEDFKPHQAEVMIKTFVPLKYIVNI